jgi:hypothetical protein
MKLAKLIFLVFIIFGCSDKNEEPELFLLVDYDDITLNCLFDEDGEYIIRSEEELIEVAKAVVGDSLWNTCIDTTQLPLDFEQYILLGKYTKHDVNDIFTRSVYKPVDADKIIYKIDIDRVAGPDNNGGFGIIYKSSMNWIKIHKPAAGVEVVIEYVVH